MTYGEEGKVLSGPAEELAILLQDQSPIVRGLAAKLVGKLGLVVFKDELERLCHDPEDCVNAGAEWALEKMKPDGGRGGLIMMRHGGYEGLKAHQAAEIVYDATVVFCDRFIDRRSRTHDQMVQAARSGKQNIVEASAAAGASSKTELKLTAVARASLEELLADYRDFLRQRGLQQWPKEEPRAQEIRKVAYQENRSYRTYFEKGCPEVAANCALCLVYQATYLLDRLIKQLEQAFVEHGGISERMYQARAQYKRR